MKIDVLFAEFPGQYQTMPSAADWVRRTMMKAKGDKRFDLVKHARFFGTPIPMLRNKCLREARDSGFDWVVMIDSDMYPDREDLKRPSAKPFWDSTVDFVFSKHMGVPCLVFAPYCGPPPHENVYVFRWRTKESRHASPDFQLDGYTREEAAILAGIQRAAAGPTGLVLIDLRVLEYLEPPWFYYGYTDRFETDKEMTEDVAFTRDVGLAPADELGCPHGLPIYCNWDAWAIHWKMKASGKPCLLTSDDVSEQYKRAAERGRGRGERLVMLGDLPTDEPLVYKGSECGDRATPLEVATEFGSETPAGDPADGTYACDRTHRPLPTEAYDCAAKEPDFGEWAEES